MAFKLYCLLLLVRFLWVFQPQPGYIHPDEFFQNPEPLAGDIFGYDVHRTWEFNKTQLTRSVFFPSLTSGISFLVLKTLSEADLLTITPALLLIFPRRRWFCVPYPPTFAFTISASCSSSTQRNALTSLPVLI
ncbi:putative GPI mannosyltransferase 4-like [Apostichopus japonicus]|uniref:Mannosyltransferase n=1 Tax=Stichopus japonicus TaxID=307972 RepID=A0A2G8KG79_STIJA|nr:putative GPI mannosyltransferase 4-like [Apostichopus japonicus]